MPYELYIDDKWSADRSSVELTFTASDSVFGSSAAGAPFSVYAPGSYLQHNEQGKPVFESVRVWDFAVIPRHDVRYQWPLAHFENEVYGLRVYGPNGFFREFGGDAHDLALAVRCGYERNRGQSQHPLSGNVVLNIRNGEARAIVVQVLDEAYGAMPVKETIPAKGEKTIVVSTEKSHGWYAVLVRIEGQQTYFRRYAGRVETGEHQKTDPYMGRVV